MADFSEAKECYISHRIFSYPIHSHFADSAEKTSFIIIRMPIAIASQVLNNRRPWEKTRRARVLSGTVLEAMRSREWDSSSSVS